MTQENKASCLHSDHPVAAKFISELSSVDRGLNTSLWYVYSIRNESVLVTITVNVKETRTKA